MFETLEAFTNNRRSSGGYSFSLAEVEQGLGLSYPAAHQTLYRHQKKGVIAPIRKGFYVIIPPEYSRSKMLPSYLFIHDLMNWLGKPYYLALYSASALHGAAHQQPMETFVITVKPALRPIKNPKLIINFFTKKEWDAADIQHRKTDAGFINLSSPELTALDLLSYLEHSGINRVISVLSELVEAINPAALRQTARRYPTTVAIQRLGYLLACELEQPVLAESLSTVLAERKYFYAPLSPHLPHQGTFIPKWKIIKNLEVESDL